MFIFSIEPVIEEFLRVSPQETFRDKYFVCWTSGEVPEQDVQMWTLDVALALLEGARVPVAKLNHVTEWNDGSRERVFVIRRLKFTSGSLLFVGVRQSALEATIC